jgi:hypothetical protein
MTDEYKFSNSEEQSAPDPRAGSRVCRDDHCRQGKLHVKDPERLDQARADRKVGDVDGPASRGENWHGGDHATFPLPSVFHKLSFIL